MKTNNTALSLVVLATVSILLFSGSVAAQDADKDGWTAVIELHEVTTVYVSYKVETNAIKLKYEWEFSRYRGSTHVFHDLAIGYEYSYGPAAETTHHCTAGKAIVKGWTQKADYVQDTDDKGRPAKDPIHTAIVTIPIKGGTKNTNNKFCWKWTSERYGTEHIIKPEEGIIYKACSPPEKDDYGSDAPSDLKTF